MLKLFLLIQQGKEAQILKAYFEQKGFRVYLDKPIISTYIKCIQYQPDIIFMELPPNFHAQVSFVQMLKKNEKTSEIPILAYGNHAFPEVNKWFAQGELHNYYGRPLKVGSIVDSLEMVLGNRLYEELRPAMSGEKSDEFKRLLNPGVKPAEKLETMASHVGRLFAFPFTIAKICEVTQDEGTGVPDLVKAIQADSSVSATILKVANSPLFSARGKRISDLKEALVRIGFNETRNIALSLTVLNMFGPREKTPGYNRVDFWYYSLATGLLAEGLCRRAGYRNTTDAFIIGLLHDLGVLLWDEFFPEIFEKAMEQTTLKGISIGEAEMELLGFTHADFLATLFEKWSLPPQIPDGIRHQCRFREFSPKTGSADLTLVRAVGVSSVLAKSLNIGGSCDQFVQAFDSGFFDEFGLKNGLEEGFLKEVYDSIEIFNEFLKLEKRNIRHDGPQGDKGIKLGLQMAESKDFEPHLLYLRRLEHRFELIPDRMSIEEVSTRCQVLVKSTGTGSQFRAEVAPPLPILVFQDQPMEVESLPYNVRWLPKQLELRRIDVILEELHSHLG